MNTPRIRSFVRREGRLTSGQAHALEQLWPKYGLEYTAQHIAPETVFGRKAPLALEIGCGNGEALIAAASAEPERDFIGVEVYRPGVGRLLAEIETAGLTNVRIICHDAMEVLESMLPPASLDRVMIYFPDPWPKKRHHKRRLVRPEVIALLARAIAPDGELWMATDWQDYAEHMLEVMTPVTTFENLAPNGGFHPDRSTRPITKFERRGLQRGHGVWDLRYRRTDNE